MARNGNGGYRQGGYGGLIVGLVLILAALGGGGYWVWSQEDEALRQLRLDADSRALEAVLPFPQRQGDDTGPDGGAGPEAGDAPSVAGTADPGDSPDDGQDTPDQSTSATSQEAASGNAGGAPDTSEMAPDVTPEAVAAAGDGADDALPPPSRPSPPDSPETGPDSGSGTTAGSDDTSQQVSIAELINRRNAGSGDAGDPAGGDDSAAPEATAPDDTTQAAEAGAQQDAPDDPLSSQLAQLSGQGGAAGQVASVMPPRELNAEPFLGGTDMPRIALIVRGLGGDPGAARQAVDGLPEAVTLVFRSDDETINSAIARARLDGHEVLVAMPIAAEDRADASAGALRSDLPNQENMRRLTAIMDRADRAVGLMSATPEGLGVDAAVIGPILTELALAGYLFVDDAPDADSPVPGLATRIGLPVARPDVWLAAGSTPDDLSAGLDELAAIAERQGHAVGVAEWTPALVEAVRAWSADLDESGARLAPISAIADTR